MPGKKGAYSLNVEVSSLKSQGKAPSPSRLNEKSDPDVGLAAEGSKIKFLESEDDKNVGCSADDGATGIDDEQSLDGIELDNGLVQFEDAKEDQKQQQSSHSTDAEEDDVELNDVQVDQQGAKSQKSAQETNPANNSKVKTRCCFKTKEHMMLTIGAISLLCFIIFVIIVAVTSSSKSDGETTSDTVIHLMSVSTEKNEVGENVTLDHDNYDEEIDGSAFTINQSITASPEPRTDEKQGTEQRQRTSEEDNGEFDHKKSIKG